MRGFSELRPFVFAGDVLCAALLDARDGSAALVLYRKLVPVLAPLDALPVIVGDADEQEAIVDGLEGRDAPVLAKDLVLASQRSGSATFERLFRERPIVDPELDALDQVSPRVADEPFAFIDEHKGRVGVAIVPTTMPSFVNVWLGLGGESLHDVSAAIAYWGAHHGPLSVVYAGVDSLELEVARPATTIEDVKRLAREQARLFPSVIDDGHGSLVALAKHLAGARRWQLWWRA